MSDDAPKDDKKPTEDAAPAEGDAPTEGDAPEGDAPESGLKSLKMKLIIAVVGVLVLVGGGVGGYVLFAGGGDEEHAEPAISLLDAAVYVDMEPFLTDLKKSGNRTRYIRLTLTIEILEDGAEAAMADANTQILDGIQTNLRSLTPDDISGGPGTQKLRDDLTAIINSAIAPHKVNAVLFKQILVQ